MSAIWHICGVDDPEEDRLTVWLLYESTGGNDREAFVLKTTLAVYSAGKYKRLKTKIGKSEKLLRGRPICWSYVMDAPKGPPMMYDGARWRMGIDDGRYINFSD